MAKDWRRWHDEYDRPGSPLAQRLRVVQHYLGRALTDAPAEPDGERRLIVLCAGDGRDVLPVLAGHERGGAVRAVLVEWDPELAGRARATAAELGLDRVEVRVGDAGLAGTFDDLAPAHVITACGVFGNISVDDMRRTVAALPALLVDGGVVIWTRGHFGDGPDPADGVRAAFAGNGFREIAVAQAADRRFRVGLVALDAAHNGERSGSGATSDVGQATDGRLFTFT